MTGQIVGHIYETIGTYPVMVIATNSLVSVSAETVAVVEPLSFYLPLTFRK